MLTVKIYNRQSDDAFDNLAKLNRFFSLCFSSVVVSIIFFFIYIISGRLLVFSIVMKTYKNIDNYVITEALVTTNLIEMHLQGIS